MKPSLEIHSVRDSAITSEAQPIEAARSDSAAERTPAQSLVHRLRGVIDKSGRYSYRLNDMAAGYAAGQGLSATEARQGIVQTFTQEFGMSPHQYLDRHYASRRETAQQNKNEPTPAPSRHVDRDR